MIVGPVHNGETLLERLRELRRLIEREPAKAAEFVDELERMVDRTFFVRKQPERDW